MRTLNKTLSLVLVLVMVLGFFGVASAATTSFTDDATIQYKDAVAAMAGFGAISGYTDGSFKPTGAVTRAEAAKLVTYAVLGASVAKTLPTATTSFTDIDANTQSWAGASIAYLVSKGVINGRDSKTFDPTGKVTAYEIAKMLLCAAGYGTQGEYTGTDWQLNVAIDAAKLGIFTGTKAADLSAAATREECALYAYNGLTKVEKVAYSKDTSTYVQADGGTGTTVDNSIAISVYGYAVAYGVITDNKATTTHAYTTIGGTDYNVATGLDLVGHYVKVTYSTATVSGVAYDYEAYSVTDLSTVVTVSTAISTVSAWNAAFGTGTITNTSGTAVKFDSTYADSTGAISGLTINADAPAAAVGTYILYKGDIKAYLAPAEYFVDVVASYTAATASATGSITFERGSSITIPKTGDTTSTTATNYAKYSIYATPAKGDVVTVTTTGELKTIAKATTASGKVTAYTSTTGKESITAGGTKYSISDYAITSSTALSTMCGYSSATIGDTYTLYLAADNKVVAVVLTGDSTDAGLVYVVKAYTKTTAGTYGAVTTNWVQCVDMTGAEVQYQTVSAATASEDKICKVSTAYNSTLAATVATFTDASALSTSTAKSALDSTNDLTTSSVKVPSTSCYFTSDTKFIYVYDKDTGAGTPDMLTDMVVATATGVQAVDASATNYIYYGTKAASDTNYTVKYVVVQGAPAASVSSTLMFVPLAFSTENAVSYTTAAGTTGTGYNNIAFIAGTPSQSIMVTAAEAGTITTPGFYTYTKDATTGLYDLTACFTANTVGFGRVDNVYSGLVTIKGLTGNGTTWANGNVTDATASSATIVDVLYLQDMLLNSGANGLTQHTTLASLSGKVVFYTYKVVSGVTTVDCIYYVADSSIAILLQPAARTTAGTLTAGAANVLTSSSTGISYQWKYSATATGTFADDTNTGNATASLTIADNTDNGYYYCVVTNALTGETVNTNTVQVNIT